MTTKINGFNSGFSSVTALEAVKGALKDIGKIDHTCAILMHDATVNLIKFGRKYIMGLVSYFAFQKLN